MTNEGPELSDAAQNSDVRLAAKRALEAIILVSEAPADPRLLAQLLELPVASVGEMCAELQAEYVERSSGFELANVAGGWRFQSCADLAPYVERFVLEGQSARLSAAALETLAIVAYKQPISRAQVSAIRGVNVDGVMRNLSQRGYIAELARDPGPGQAILFGTTSLFLDRLGINSLDDLAPLGAFVPSAEVLEALEAGLAFELDEDDVVEQDTETMSETNTETGEVIDLTDDSNAAQHSDETLEALEVLGDNPQASN